MKGNLYIYINNYYYCYYNKKINFTLKIAEEKKMKKR